MNKPNIFLILATASVGLALTAASTKAADVGFGTNLIENGNFEDTAAVAGYSSGAGVAIGGWEDGLTYGATTAGSLSTDTRPLTYANDSGQEFVSNTASTSLYPGPTAGPLAALGNNYIYSGPGAGLSGMSQTIDLTGNAAVMSAVLAGTADYDFNGYFGGWDTQPDQINLEASFRNAANTEVGSVLIGSVTPADRGNNRDAFVYRSATGKLPTDTESIVFTWISGPSMSGSNSGVADNVSFSIGTGTAPPSISSLSPADDATNVALDTDFVATFNKNITLTGAGTITVTDGSETRVVNLDGSADDGNASILANVLTITLDADLTNNLSTYDVFISSDAIVDTDPAQNPFAGTSAGDWSFTTASTGLFTDIPGLSAGAQGALVAHYDGRTGVSATGGVVNSWTPVDGNGVALTGMIVITAGEDASLITYDGTGSLTFDDSTGSNGIGQYLQGNLVNAATANFTVFWKGHYDSGSTHQNSGMYAYNIGSNDTAHQRDDGGGGYVMETYNGTTYAGDDITAHDNVDSVWSMVLTASTHTAYVNGTNLNLAGAPTNSIDSNANIFIGAFGSSGYDHVGDMSQLIIFESALSDADRGLVENYLTNLTSIPGTAPAWISTWPQVDGVTASGATARARIDADGTAYFVVVADGASAPSSSEVKAGTGAGGSSAIASGSIALTNDVEATASIGGLTAETDYDVYFVAEDNDPSPNLQATPVVVGISTLSIFDAWGGGVAPDDDANGDGVANSLAFLLGADDPDENAAARMPTGSADGSGGLVLVFDCLPEAERGGMELKVAHSSDLGVSDAWSATPVVPDTSGGPFNGVTFVVDTVSAAPLNRVTATIGAAEAAGGKIFGRLQTFGTPPTGLVYRTQVTTDTWRDIEYHLDTGNLYLVGEQAHGLDYQNGGGNDFWWCNMGTGLDGTGLLEFLMANNPGVAAAKTTATGNGWSGYTGAQYSFLIFEPLAAQQTFVNHTAGETDAYTSDYDTVTNDNLLITIYLDSNADRSFFGLGGPSLNAVTTPLPPGDGTSDRDNGGRYDIAFKTNIQLSEVKKQELMSTFAPVSPLYDDSSSAYYYVHPPGL